MKISTITDVRGPPPRSEKNFKKLMKISGNRFWRSSEVLTLFSKILSLYRGSTAKIKKRVTEKIASLIPFCNLVSTFTYDTDDVLDRLLVDFDASDFVSLMA